MKKILIFSVLFLLMNNAYSVNIPVFNMPPDNYKLFTHSTVNKNVQQSKENNALTPNNISVSGIFQSQGEYYALINHKVCKKGDEIEGYTIKKIENNKVVLSKDGVESEKVISTNQQSIFFSDDTISNDNDSKH